MSPKNSNKIFHFGPPPIKISGYASISIRIKVKSHAKGNEVNFCNNCSGSGLLHLKHEKSSAGHYGQCCLLGAEYINDELECGGCENPGTRCPPEQIEVCTWEENCMSI